MEAKSSTLDRLMPRYEVNEVHERHVSAEPAVVYAAALAVTAPELGLLAPLMFLRTLPARLTRAEPGIDSSVRLLELFAQIGCVQLPGRPGAEIVVGAVGKFWLLRGNKPLAMSPEEFQAFETPGYTRFVTSLLILPDGEGSRVVTETRCASTSPDAARSFGRYWLLIRHGSGAIRRSWLKAIARRATRA